MAIGVLVLNSIILEDKVEDLTLISAIAYNLPSFIADKFESIGYKYNQMSELL